MDFNEFVEYIRNEIGDYLLNEDIDNIMIQPVTKNNNQKLTGLVIKLENENIVPNIYLEPYYEAYEDGHSLDEIMRDIVALYKQQVEHVRKSEFMDIASYTKDEIYDKVIYKVCNYESNKDRLSGTLYKQDMDLCKELRLVVELNEDGVASCSVTNAMLVKYDLDINTLWEKATENTEKMFPPVVQDLGNMLSMMGGPEMPNAGIYVLSNKQSVNGAAAMYYNNNKIEQLADELECNFYIIPSSIHEVLLVPDNSGMNAKYLQEIVLEANSMIVEPKDRLSGSVYKFDNETRTISIAEKDPELTKQQEIIKGKE